MSLKASMSTPSPGFTPFARKPAIRCWMTCLACVTDNDLLVSLESDPNNKLSNAELIAKVEELAFDAFSWKREPAAGSAAPATPPASPRAVAAAQAAAAGSSTPPLPGRGAGSNLTASQVNLEDVKPGQFGKLPANVQKELLGEDD